MAAADQPAAVVAVWSPSEADWRFVVMFGCPFGLGSVVNTFNRFPALAVAMSRRILLLPHGAYFDDNLYVDAGVAAAAGQELLREWFAILGTPCKPAKGFPVAPYRTVLGATCEVALACLENEAVVRPRDISKDQVVEDLEIAVLTGSMTSGQAAKTRG